MHEPQALTITLDPGAAKAAKDDLFRLISALLRFREGAEASDNVTFKQELTRLVNRLLIVRRDQGDAALANALGNEFYGFATAAAVFLAREAIQPILDADPEADIGDIDYQQSLFEADPLIDQLLKTVRRDA